MASGKAAWIAAVRRARCRVPGRGLRRGRRRRAHRRGTARIQSGSSGPRKAPIGVPAVTGWSSQTFRRPAKGRRKVRAGRHALTSCSGRQIARRRPALLTYARQMRAFGRRPGQTYWAQRTCATGRVYRGDMTHGVAAIPEVRTVGRLHNYPGSAGRRGGSSTADLSTQSRLLALAIAPWAAGKGILDWAARTGRRRST